MNKFVSLDVEVVDEIMATTVYVKLTSQTKTRLEVEQDLKICLDLFREFESDYSRFIKNNTLDKFNESEKGELSVEFFDILKKAKELNVKTNGIFDIGVLPILQSQGYTVSKNEGFVGKKQKQNDFVSIKKLELLENNKYIKPKNLKIDLGGIGKGYITDKITQILRSKGYSNFIIDAGGDIRFEGKDIEEKNNFWICGVESPIKENNEDTVLLKINGMSIATSGTNKRNWNYEGMEKNHLIDIKNSTSVNSDKITCTVIAKNTIEADVWAKTLLIMDFKSAVYYANKKRIPFLFIDKNNEVTLNNFFKKYLYEI